jgi:hypothetical protein
MPTAADVSLGVSGASKDPDLALYSDPSSSALGIKLIFLLMFAALVVMSTFFVDNVLSGIEGATQGRTPTAWGTVIQAGVIAGGFTVIHHLDRMKIL